MKRLIAALCLPFALAAHANDSIRIQEVDGFSGMPNGELFTLLNNGPAVRYTSSDENGDVGFLLSLDHGSFVMRAERDNRVAECGCLPYGLAAYGATGPVIPPADGVEDTSLFFLDWTAYPELVGQPIKFAVSAVPEPGTVALLLAGLGVVGIAARRRHAVGAVGAVSVASAG